jgi:hypothetical protein
MVEAVGTAPVEDRFGPQPDVLEPGELAPYLRTRRSIQTELVSAITAAASPSDAGGRQKVTTS